MVKIGSRGDFAVRADDQFTKNVLGVHHVVEGKSCIDARRRQNLRKGAMYAVRRIVVSRACVVADSQPWFDPGQEMRLETCFDGVCSRPLGQRAPASKLT